MQFVDKILFQINTEIEKLGIDDCMGIDSALHMMRFIQPLGDELRKYILAYQFADETEEISFFKEYKPEVLSKYLYYNKIYVIESKYPTGSDITVLNLLIWIGIILPETKTIYEYVQTVPILIKTLYIQPDMILKWLKLLPTNC